jgi:hypothetical protein
MRLTSFSKNEGRSVCVGSSILASLSEAGGTERPYLWNALVFPNSCIVKTIIMGRAPGWNWWRHRPAVLTRYSIPVFLSIVVHQIETHHEQKERDAALASGRKDVLSEPGEPSAAEFLARPRRLDHRHTITSKVSPRTATAPTTTTTQGDGGTGLPSWAENIAPPQTRQDTYL